MVKNVKNEIVKKNMGMQEHPQMTIQRLVECSNRTLKEDIQCTSSQNAAYNKERYLVLKTTTRPT